VRHFAPAEAKESAQEKMSAVIALRLFRPPLAASVTVREARPVQMQCPQRAGVAGKIVWTAGPWRSSATGRNRKGWSREEWDIAVPHESGLALYRLVQDKLDVIGLLKECMTRETLTKFRFPPCTSVYPWFRLSADTESESPRVLSVLNSYKVH